jgi:hypothetical protein
MEPNKKKGTIRRMDTIQALSVNDHLELEIGKHPERTFFATLLESRPQFSVDWLLAEVQAETEYWVTLLANPKNGKTFLQNLEGIRHVFDALKHEDSALKDVAYGVTAHSKGDWAEASTYYCKAMSDLHFAHSDWNFAIHELADDTPFDPYYPTKAERVKHNIEDPPRSSDSDMCEVAPGLFRIHRNVDRTFCLGQELVQRQITCLTNYMQEAEAKHTAGSEEQTEINETEE